MANKARYKLGLMVVAMGILLATNGRAFAEGLTLDGSTTVGPIAKAFAHHYEELNPAVQVTVSESGSGNGFKSLLNSACDIACMSRFIKHGEYAAAVKNDIYPVLHVVAMDGIAVIVHPSNPVGDLTVEQLRKIYAGEITKWSDLGGPPVEIVVICRETNSGTYESFKELVMTYKAGEEKKQDKINSRAEFVGSNGAVRTRVQSTPGAIGYVGVGFVDRTVKATLVNGVEPTPENIANGKYPIARPLFMVTDGYPELGSDVYSFVTLHLTKKGQEIIESIGFVPLTKY